MNTTLVSTNNGFHDFDLTGYGGVKRATISPSIKKGELFNVYLEDGAKIGATWLGSKGINEKDLLRSIKKAAKTAEQSVIPAASTIAAS